MALLEIRGLKKHFVAGTEVLRGVDLTVQAGEFVVVIGPSGAGKTTLIRCINRLVDATAGEIFFDGTLTRPLRGAKLRRLRSQMGMIFQDYNLIGRSNVMQNVLHGRLGQMSALRSAVGWYTAGELQEAQELLAAVGLADFAHVKAQTLSGGQMQRVGVCRAMMQRPKLLLADEPISSLDPTAAKTVLDGIKTLTAARGLTGIINLHQVEFARQYASRIIGLRQGQVVFDGAPDALTDEMADYIYVS